MASSRAPEMGGSPVEDSMTSDGMCLVQVAPHPCGSGDQRRTLSTHCPYSVHAKRHSGGEPENPGVKYTG